MVSIKSWIFKYTVTPLSVVKELFTSPSSWEKYLNSTLEEPFTSSPTTNWVTQRDLSTQEVRSTAVMSQRPLTLQSFTWTHRILKTFTEWWTFVLTIRKSGKETFWLTWSVTESMDTIKLMNHNSLNPKCTRRSERDMKAIPKNTLKSYTSKDLWAKTFTKKRRKSSISTLNKSSKHQRKSPKSLWKTSQIQKAKAQEPLLSSGANTNLHYTANNFKQVSTQSSWKSSLSHQLLYHPISQFIQESRSITLMKE